jgi:hypothetical protein
MTEVEKYKKELNDKEIVLKKGKEKVKGDYRTTSRRRSNKKKINFSFNSTVMN